MKKYVETQPDTAGFVKKFSIGSVYKEPPVCVYACVVCGGVGRGGGRLLENAEIQAL